MKSNNPSQPLLAISPDTLLPSLTAGLIIGLVEIILAVSYAALIFSGELAPFVMNGIGFGLLGATVSSLAVGLYSSIKGTAGGNQNAPSAILAVVAAAIVGSMPAGATPEATFSTVVVTIALTTLMTGLAFVALGYFRLGRLVRFLPYPVIGGFLAGTGWLLLLGAVGLMTNTTDMGVLLTPAVLMRWLPGLGLALILFLAPRFSPHYLVLPGLIIGSGIVFHLAAWLIGTPLAVLSEQGWLLGPFPEQNLFQPLILLQLEGVHWPLIVQQLPNIFTILLTSTFALLLTASGLGLALKEESDLNRDLRAAGAGNMLSGLFAGFVGYQHLSLSVLNHRLGAGNRLPGVVVALMCSVTLLFGASALSIAPKFVVAGLLLYIGLNFLYEWVYKAWSTFPRLDYVTIVLILLVIASVGFLEGVAVGILAAVILFVVNYSRINIIRHVLSGAEYQSRVMRPLLYRRLLEQRGGQLHILELQGFLFFGTAQQLIEHIQARIKDTTQPKLNYLLIDFRLVTGIDSSVTLSLGKLQQIVEAEGFHLLLTQLGEEMRAQWEEELFEEGWHTFVDLDQGVAWCEEQMIAQFAEVGLSGRPLSLAEQIEKQLREVSEEEVEWSDYLRPGDKPAPPPQMQKLMAYAQRLEVDAGEVILREGQPVPGLYLIEEGQVVAETRTEEGRVKMWSTLETGTVFGEMGLYTGSLASADVRVTKPAVLLFLPAEHIRQMEAELPELAAAIHRLIVADLAEKLAQSNRLARALREK